MKRREFIGLVGGAAAWPLSASAQQAGRKIVTIGILAIEPWPPIDTFRQALDDLGYIEGKNVRFEYRYSKGYNKQLPELANDLVGLNVDVILTWGTDAVLAAKQAAASVPATRPFEPHSVRAAERISSIHQPQDRSSARPHGAA
jgi:putative ABC transport system substrate-binding protein